MPAKPRVIIAANGTLGDLLPATALGRAAAERGFDTVLLANDIFRDLATHNGVGFRSTGKADAFSAFVDGAAWKGEAHSWSAFLREGIMPSVKPTDRHIAELTAEGRPSVVVAFNYAYGARLTARRLGLPFVNAYIQPAMFDAHAGDMGAASEFAATEAQAEAYGRAVRAAEDYVFKIFTRSKAGPVSEERYLGLFPEWFAPSRAVWPAGTRLTGLPLIDTAAEGDMSDGLEAFLSDGPAPVGFYCGSFMRDARAFFRAGIEACRMLGLRAVIVHRFAEDLPGDLPEDILVERVVPFGRLMPRLAALIHQGGIGTTAQAMAAGIPQVALPLRFDQASNAAYMAKLGVGEVLSVEETGEGLAERLRHVLDDDGVKRACADCARRMVSENPFESAVDMVVEGLV